MENNEEQAGLSVTDLANIKQIIDTAAARGAFKTEEFGVIGNVCDKLATFITASQANAQQEPTKAQEKTKEKK